MGPLDIVFGSALDGWTTALLYIDPGSGALILQFLAGVGIGIVYYFRKALARLKGWIPGLEPEQA